jgi:TolA-binding protein
MKSTTTILRNFLAVALVITLVLAAKAPMAQGTDLEARINELEAALDHLQERIEKLEQKQTPQRMSKAEAEAVLRKKQAEDECTEQLGPAPEFAPVLGTKVNPEYMAYLKKHRACMRDKGVL